MEQRYSFPGIFRRIGITVFLINDIVIVRQSTLNPKRPDLVISSSPELAEI